MRQLFAIVFIAAYAVSTPCTGQNDTNSALGGAISPGSGKDPEISAQRADIAAQRAQAQSRFDDGARLCYQKFAVNDCLNNLRAQRRETLADLRRQDIELNNQERRALAAERVQSVQDKTRSADEREALAGSQRATSQPEKKARPAPRTPKAPRALKAPQTPRKAPVSAPQAVASQATSSPSSTTSASKAPQAAVGAAAGQLPSSASSASDRHQTASQRAQRASDKQARLQAAQEAADKRAKERQVRGEKPVPGLPTPP